MSLASSVTFFYCFIQLILAVCYIYIVKVSNVDTVKAAEHLQFLCIYLCLFFLLFHLSSYLIFFYPILILFLTGTDSTSDGHFPPRSRSSGTLKSSSPYTRSSYSPLSRSTPSGSDKRSGPPLLQKLDHNKLSDWKVEIAVPNAPPVQGVCEDNLPNKKGIVGRFLEQGENKNNRHLNSKIEAKRALFENKHDDKTLKFGGLRSGSRVVPVQEKETSESTVQRSNTSEELIGGNKDNDLSLIRKQLVQIESQQSSLLDLLQV